jgi:hypothetical protein
MKKIIAAVFVILLLAACAPPPQAIQSAVAGTQAAWTQVPTQTAYATYTAYPTMTEYPTYTAVIVTQVVTQIVTITSTPMPLYTPTDTGTPTKTPNVKATTTAEALAALRADKGDGSYMVGTEIAPGIWRSGGGNSDEKCWIQIKKLSGDLMGIAGDLPGGTIRIPAGEYIVYIGGGSGNKCTWSFLKP